jgi:hypothetical protein
MMCVSFFFAVSPSLPVSERPQNNIRFEDGKRAALSTLPDSAPLEERERALSEFYARWVVSEDARLSAYSRQWRSRNWSLLRLGFVVAYRRGIARLRTALSFGKGKAGSA